MTLNVDRVGSSEYLIDRFEQSNPWWSDPGCFGAYETFRSDLYAIENGLGSWSDTRLIGIAGPKGVGKTRLAKQAIGVAVGAFVTEAVESYLGAMLASGGPPEGTANALRIDVSVGSVLETHLESAVEEDANADSLSELARSSLPATLGEGVEGLEFTEFTQVRHRLLRVVTTSTPGL